MTRINLINPEELQNKHLLAEYRELPRIFKLAKNWYNRGGDSSSLPLSYVLGKGHVIFFYNKCHWLVNRQKLLIKEMQKRGMKPQHIDPESLVEGFPDCLLGDWKPDEKDINLNKQRISERLSNMGVKNG